MVVFIVFVIYGLQLGFVLKLPLPLTHRDPRMIDFTHMNGLIFRINVGIYNTFRPTYILWVMVSLSKSPCRRADLDSRVSSLEVKKRKVVVRSINPHGFPMVGMNSSTL